MLKRRRLFILWSFIFAGLISGGEGVTCQSGGNPTTLSATYTNAGVFTVTVSNLEQTEDCQLEVTKWNSASPSTSWTNTKAPCTGLTSIEITESAPRGYFQYGEQFSFVLTRTATGGSTLLCTVSVSITPAECTSPGYVQSSVRILKRPGAIVASVLDKPQGYDCDFTAVGTTDFTDGPTKSSTGCVPTTWAVPTALATDKHYSLRVGVRLSADTIADTPVCGVNAAPMTLSPCSGATLTTTNTAIDEITVKISGALAGHKCEVSLSKWNGADVAVSRTSADCSSVSFRARDAGSAFTFGTTDYTVELAQYPNSVLDTTTAAPTCVLLPAATQFTAPPCTTDATDMRVDPEAISVSLASAVTQRYGVCRVVLTEYASTAVSAARVGMCDQPFEFTTADLGGVTFDTGDSVEYYYEFFSNGDVSSTPTCFSPTPTSGGTVKTFQVDAFAAAQSLLVVEYDGNAVVSIAAPVPTSGTCKVVVRSVGGSALGTAVSITMDSCGTPYVLKATDLAANAGLTTWSPGSALGLTWSSTTGGTVTTSASTASTTVYFDVPITRVTSIDTALSFTYAIPTALLDYISTESITTHSCKLSLISCNGVTKYTVDNPGNCATATRSVTGLTKGDVCLVKLEVLNSGTALGSSGEVSAVAGGAPSWGGSQAPAVSAATDDCLEISWEAPSGGSAVTCYEVSRKDGSAAFVLIRDCDAADPLSRSAISCTFDDGTAYTFKVNAKNAWGEAFDLSVAVQPEWVRAAPASVLQAPPEATLPLASTGVAVFVAGGLPAFEIQEKHPLSPLTTVAADTDFRLYVATLVSRCKLDTTGTLKIPLISSDPGYVDPASLPIPPNSPPGFTLAFSAKPSDLGHYSLSSIAFGGSGYFSLLLYSLEAGGLQGLYWASSTITGVPTVSRKDAGLDFNWGLGAIINSAYDLVSVRWVGIIEAPFTETFTFMVFADDAVRVWVDDVLIINRWHVPCAQFCSGRADLRQSTAAARAFSHIRIEFMHSKGPAQVKLAKLAVKWVSYSQPLAAIPASRLFKAEVLTSTPRYITIEPATTNAAVSTLSVEDGPYHSGSEYAVRVTARDEYGNLVTDGSAQFTATVTPSAGGTVAGVYYSAPVSGSVGLYEILIEAPPTGDYTVAVEDDNGDAVSGSGFQMHVVVGAPYTVVSASTLTANPVANGILEFQFKLNDIGGGDVDDPAAGAQTYISLTWTADAVTQNRLTVNDVAWRTEKYGTLFDQPLSAPVYDTGTSKYRVSMRVPLAGTYDVTIGVRDSAGAAATISPVTVLADVNSVDAVNAVINMLTFPPEDLEAGQTSNIYVQIRDAHMNVINDFPTSPTPEPVIKVFLQGSSSTPCVKTQLVNGQYECPLIPEQAGANLALSVMVDDAFASFLYDSPAGVRSSRGPWRVSVAPGAVDADQCTVSGLKTTYVVGVPADLTLKLRDANGNSLAGVDVQGNVQITASLTPTPGPEVFMNPSTFVYHTELGTVTIPILATSAASLVVDVKVGANSVTLPFTTVSAIHGVVSATHTACTVYSATTAGIETTSTCTPKDAGDILVTWAGLYMESKFFHQTDPAVTVTKTGTDAGGTYTFTTGTSLQQSGAYWYYTLIGQPGGLVAKYYALATFETLLAPNGQILTDLRAPNEDPVIYSAIEPILSIDNGGQLVVDEVTVRSIQWRGLLRAPFTGDVEFRVRADGAVRISIDSGGLTFLEASSVDEEFTLTSLALGDYLNLEIDYIPNGAETFSLEWKYGTADYFKDYHIVPPSFMHAVLVNDDSQPTLIVSPAAPSIKSTAFFSDNVVANADDFITIQALDEFGNAWTTDPDPTNAGTYVFAATCDDGTSSGTLANNGDGTFSLPFEFTTDGVKTVTVTLAVGGAGAATINNGVPITLTVGPGA